MLCPECQGMGTTGCWDEEHKCFVELECKRCHGTGDTVGTNQEWLDSLPTKEKAEVLCEFMRGPSKLRGEIDRIVASGGYDITPAKAIEKWLKEEHHDEA